MAKLIYSVIASLDGFIEDERGTFDWAVPDAELHAFINDLERPIGTYLYGRRLYETMVYWESPSLDDDESDIARDFARVWRNADKIVFSRTLDSPTSERTRIERDLDPEAIRRLVQSSAHDLSIGGPELAHQAIAAGLVDECQLFLCPVVVGGGKPALPARRHMPLTLLDERRFSSGVVYLRYSLRD